MEWSGEEGQFTGSGGGEGKERRRKEGPEANIDDFLLLQQQRYSWK